jgi:hypothetical protein
MFQGARLGPILITSQSLRIYRPFGFQEWIKIFFLPQQGFENGRKAIDTNSLSIKGSVASSSLVG